MKLNSYLAAAFATAALAQAASAQTTVIDVTGATAFRAAAVTAIRNSFASTPEYGFHGSSFGGASRHIFKGTFPGITGTTIVRTSWSGSTEGARAVVFGLNNPYIISTVGGYTTAGTSLTPTSSTENAATHDLWFSDVSFSNTVYNSSFNQIGGTGLRPTEAAKVSGLVANTVGAIPWVLLKNKTSASFTGLTNITRNQIQQMVDPANTGVVNLSLFTGDNNDDGKLVFWTGRNDFSGTRTSYMLHNGLAASALVSQWKPVSASNVMTSVQLWPATDGVNTSVQWTLADSLIAAAHPGLYPTTGTPVAGNGGFDSSGTLTGFLDDTSATTDVLNAAGDELIPDADVAVVTWIDIPNAVTAINAGAGATALSYNGVSIIPATPLLQPSKDKILNGSYSAWNFEQFLRSGTASAAEITVYNAVRNNIDATAINSVGGLTTTEMTGITRDGDGGKIFVPSF